MLPPDSEPSAQPYGRAAVEQALIESAAELFATRIPYAVTVREIAEHAHVNHGLVHQYFGSKHELLVRTMKHLALDLVPIVAQSMDLATAMPALLDQLVERPALVRLITWSLLGEDGASNLPGGFPVLRLLIARAAEDSPGDDTRIDPRIAAGMAASMLLGWVMYQDYINSALDLSDLPQSEIHESISEVISAVLSWNHDTAG